MEYDQTPLEKRLKENIKQYRLGQLLEEEPLNRYMGTIAMLAEAGLVLTDRDGKTVAEAGLSGETGGEGIPVTVEQMQMGYLYCSSSAKNAEIKPVAEELSLHAQAKYRLLEYSLYIRELQEQMHRECRRYGEKEDGLTGVLSKAYFEDRMNVIDRSGMVPVAVIVGNINDWKYVNDRYGDMESDRLIRIVAGMLKQEAKDEYVIGRVDGDVFEILIPMPELQEAKEYCMKVGKLCNAFEDDQLAPSIAFGYVMKTNVEETITNLYSDAEYEMFQNKLEIKQQKDYRNRLEKK